MRKLLAAVGALVPVLVGPAPSMATIRATNATAVPVGKGCGPGSIVVAQGAEFVNGPGPGSVMCYPAGSTGDVVPAERFTKAMDGPCASAFDALGDLWVCDGNNTLVEYPKAQLSQTGPVPSVVIEPDAGLGSPAAPYDITFDRSGDLWLTNNSTDTVTEYARDQLVKSGSPTPRTTISYTGLQQPGTLRFDPSGDLWVSTYISLLEFAKAQLGKPSPAPTVVLSSGTWNWSTCNGAFMSLASPRGTIAFDPHGDLWYTCFALGTVVEFTKAQLARSGDPVPHITISSNLGGLPGGTIDAPSGLVFGSSGDAWVSNSGNNSVVEFAKDQLAESGSPVPVRVVVGPRTGLKGPADVQITP